MKPWSRIFAGTALILSCALPASAQVVRVELISPVNESATAYNPGASVAAAAATVVPAGSLTGITITSPGSGYTGVAPTVAITGGGGTGAAATATVENGAVTAINLTSAGSGYTSAPTVTLSGGGGGTGATATATVAPGAITAITVGSPGTGYTSAPAISFTGGGGSGATATATIANGAITGIAVTSGGTGYTAAPTVVIAQPPGIVTIAARVTGTTGFTTQFFVDGKPVSVGIGGDSPATAWNPPQPGAYFITALTTDGFGNTAKSQPVRVFVTGAKIFNPIANTLVPQGSSVVVSADALFADPANPTEFGGLVKQIEFFVNDVSVGIDSTAPYSVSYTPPVVGVYNLTAVATDNYGHTIKTPAAVPIRVVAPIGTPPTARVANPVDNSSVVAGREIGIIADANDSDGFISKVEFYLNGALLNTDVTFPFTASWTPPVAGRYIVVALVFDDKGNVTTSAPTTVNVTGGLPTVQIASPSVPGTTVIQGTKVAVTVAAAGPDGGITSLSSVQFLVDGNVNDSLPKNPTNAFPPPPLTQPFVFTWQSNVTLGTHRLSARVTDANGLSINSAEVPVTVIANQLPQISLTSPGAGASLSSNTATTIVASASDPDGSVESVEFFLNGVSLGAPITKAPFQVSWTPTNAGPYTVSAKVTDNAGATVSTPDVAVTVDPQPTNNSGNSVSTSVFRGDYASLAENGRFALAVNRNGRGTFIAFSTNPSGRNYFWADFPVGSDGTFIVRDAAERVLLRGQTSSTGVSGSFGDKTFIGPITLGSATLTPMVLSGALTGDANSSLVAIAGGDGSITIYSASGNNREVGTDFLSPTGSYAFTTPTGGRLSGNVTSSAGVVSGNVSGAVTGSFLLRQQPSRLVNISTRSAAGTGDRTMVAGFVIRGSGTKPLLIRAVGPTLANFGVAGALSDPSLTILNNNASTSATAVNNDWNNSAALSSVAAQVGAFPLNAGSRDSALTVSLAPGTYSAAVGGGAAALATALLEVYDTEAGNGSARITNISTRGQVSAGDPLIAGFVIAGDERKRLLIRAVGPSLANFGITGVLADPRIELLSGATSIATNNDWTDGSVVSQVNQFSSALGAFTLDANSKDAAFVVQLNPGAYTVQVSGVNGGVGTALVEIYDADQP